jgi:hypothetical protein
LAILRNPHRGNIQRHDLRMQTARCHVQLIEKNSIRWEYGARRDALQNLLTMAEPS